MTGEFETRQFMLPELIRDFVLGGNAVFTLRSKETGQRFTYKVTKGQASARYPDQTYWCKLLWGSDNDNDYRYFGFFKEYTIQGEKGYAYYHGQPNKACASRTAESVKAFTYTIGNVLQENRMPEGVEFWHAGRCGRCGRTLTDPESTEAGFGPECRSKMGA